MQGPCHAPPVLEITADRRFNFLRVFIISTLLLNFEKIKDFSAPNSANLEETFPQEKFFFRQLKT